MSGDQELSRVSEEDKQLVEEVALILSEEMADWRGDPWSMALVLYEEGLLGEY